MEVGKLNEIYAHEHLLWRFAWNGINKKPSDFTWKWGFNTRYTYGQQNRWIGSSKIGTDRITVVGACTNAQYLAFIPNISYDKAFVATKIRIDYIYDDVIPTTQKPRMYFAPKMFHDGRDTFDNAHIYGYNTEYEGDMNVYHIPTDLTSPLNSFHDSPKAKQPDDLGKSYVFGYACEFDNEHRTFEMSVIPEAPWVFRTYDIEFTPPLQQYQGSYKRVMGIWMFIDNINDDAQLQVILDGYRLDSLDLQRENQWRIEYLEATT